MNDAIVPYLGAGVVLGNGDVLRLLCPGPEDGQPAREHDGGNLELPALPSAALVRKLSEPTSVLAGRVRSSATSTILTAP